MNPVRLVDSWLALPFRGVILIYRKLVSPFLPGACRFEPSCSCYADEAFKRWGFVRGFGLAFWRICRCQPLSKGGWDPVPGADRGTAPGTTRTPRVTLRGRRISRIHALEQGLRTRHPALRARQFGSIIEEQS